MQSDKKESSKNEKTQGTNKDTKSSTEKQSNGKSGSITSLVDVKVGSQTHHQETDIHHIITDHTLTAAKNDTHAVLSTVEKVTVVPKDGSKPVTAVDVKHTVIPLSNDNTKTSDKKSDEQQKPNGIDTKTLDDKKPEQKNDDDKLTDVKQSSNKKRVKNLNIKKSVSDDADDDSDDKLTKSTKKTTKSDNDSDINEDISDGQKSTTNKKTDKKSDTNQDKKDTDDDGSSDDSDDADDSDGDGSKEVDEDELSKHLTPGSCWMKLNGQVIDLSSALSKFPILGQLTQACGMAELGFKAIKLVDPNIGKQLERFSVGAWKGGKKGIKGTEHLASHSTKAVKHALGGLLHKHHHHHLGEAESTLTSDEALLTESQQAADVQAAMGAISAVDNFQGKLMLARQNHNYDKKSRQGTHSIQHDKGSNRNKNDDDDDEDVENEQIDERNKENMSSKSPKEETNQNNPIGAPSSQAPNLVQQSSVPIPLPVSNSQPQPISNAVPSPTPIILYSQQITENEINCSHHSVLKEIQCYI